MFIKSLELSNIRSYENQSIDFKSGTTLLSGDIGSGKTTILIALEYALFGLLRGKTQPSELLRHSAKEGYVALDLEIAGHDVRITRGMKRGKNSISQTPGTILIDGVEETYVTTELKARILTLMGYPESLLSKSTNLFRYTVYTPQEQVKHILYETVEERKDIIRKIFGIDKYKRVIENTTPYIADLRERIARSKGQTDNVKILSEQLLGQEKELLVIQGAKKPLELSLVSATQKTKSVKEIYVVKRKEQDEQKKEITKQQLAAQKIIGEKKLLELLQTQYTHLGLRLKQQDIKEIVYDKNIQEKIRLVLEQLSQRKSLLNKKYGELNAKQSQSTQLQQQILDLTTCPTCQQDVGSDHKEHINQEQIILQNAVNKKREKYDAIALQIQEKENHLQTRMKEERELEKKHYLFIDKKKQFEIDIKRQEQLAVSVTEKERTIQILEKDQFAQIKITLVDLKKEELDYELARQQEQHLALSLKEQTTKEILAINIISTLRQTIFEKEKISQQISFMTDTRTWVQELFIPLTRTIEKRVLLNIYQEFNTYFTQWFSMLIDDESLSVRLDEDFTPLIEQHGYDTSIGNLSGGEKTSVALAYRLALNKVLNDYFSFLHTKGLLILDEPTDGFSSQQLDKLRDVLDEIGVKQVIIVSHEQKLESVADHLIYVTKDHQISKICHS